MIAAERGHIETVKLLINNKADINLNNWGNTALMMAAKKWAYRNSQTVNQ